MKKIKFMAFTLIELLTIWSILPLIWTISYQNYWWKVNKAINGRKINDVSTLETALQQYKADDNYYPSTDIYNKENNVWWYNSLKKSTPSNKIRVTYNWTEIATILTWSSIGWGKVYWIWAFNTIQIWAKWTISRDTIWKKYLSRDLYDQELGDLKVWDTKMIDYWVWRFIYTSFKKDPNKWDWSSNYNWLAYNIAYTFKKDWSDTYITKVIWDYDQESCYDDKDKCPVNLVWLNDWDTQSWSTDKSNYWLPYAVTDFAQ